jgi:uncharacterized cupredoxin-like copper-binding protein
MTCWNPLSFLGTLSNAGTIEVHSSGFASFASAVAGTGTLGLSGTAILKPGAASAATQTVAFTAGANQIDLLQTPESSYSFAHNILTVENAGQVVASLTFESDYKKSDFVLQSDQHGGTRITFT